MTATLNGIKWNFTRCESCIEGRQKTVWTLNSTEKPVFVDCRRCDGRGYNRTKDKSNWNR